ncbi:hypothetical protein ES332_A02G205200v1 [Gossypium tomentosum]|uniref:Uncharacterized protein n=1 Tax=Gossypium tomentosum TaxID=34277 RepID=A0A5D2RJK7_GOSTO|nr:hypothetical protein ES332_A02G205200v1 [Gossypium tomentosum]
MSRLRGSASGANEGGWPTMEWVMVVDSRAAHLEFFFFGGYWARVRY